MPRASATVVPFPSLEQWKQQGRELGERERQIRSLMWDIGDWWNRGEPYGVRADVVKAPDWDGPTHGAARNAGSVAARWDVSSRDDSLTFKHYEMVTPLADEHAEPLLQWCGETEPVRTTQQLATRIKQVKRAQTEAALAERIEHASEAVGHQVYGVIYADPPWKFEPYSGEGMDRAAENHYPTMTQEELFDMEIMRTAPADACVLFCWATVPMLPDALEWMEEYGFVYRSHCVWIKDKTGTGYWFRNEHELLLVGVRGDVPGPAPGTQYPSVIEAPVGKHSEKPDKFAAMVTELFPTVAKIELFARKRREGWDSWGAEAEYPTSDR